MALQVHSSFNEKDNRWDLAMNGEVDISNAPELRETLDSVYREKESDITLHFQDLQYIDSTGLGVIIGAHGRMQENGHRISILNPRNNIKKLLNITCLDRIFCDQQ